MKYLFKPYISFIKIGLLKIPHFLNNSTIPQIFNILLKVKYFKIITIIINILKLIEMKNFAVAFELFDSLADSLDQTTYLEIIKSLFAVLLNTYDSLKQTNKKLYIEFCKYLVVFTAKISIKVGNDSLFQILEAAAPNSIMPLLMSLLDHLPDLNNNKNKKLVTYMYCLIINEFCSQFDHETLKYFGIKLIKHLQKFYQTNFNSMYINKDLETELNYTANSYNKLYNAEVKVIKSLLNFL